MIPSVDIDFEIFSEVSIKDVGLDNYVNHPSTKVICMAYSIDEGEVKLWTPTTGHHSIPDQYRLVAHNANFELAIIEVHGAGLDLLFPGNYTCTAAQAAIMGLPRSLEGASKALNLSQQKDTEGKRVMLQVTKPRRPSKTNSSEDWFFNKEKMDTTYEYCKQDVVVEQLIEQSTYGIRPAFERQVFQLDRDINVLGIPVDLPLVHSAIALATKFRTALDEEMYELSEGDVAGVGATAQLRAYLARNGCPVDSVAKDALPGLLELDLSADLHRLIECRAEGALSSVAKYRKIADWTSEDGRLRNIFMYHGAHTGRWTGKGPQLHNLPRGKYKGDKFGLIASITDQDHASVEQLADEQGLSPMEALSSCIREAFYAGEHHTFVAGDYSGIEVRVLAWLAGQEDLVRLLAEGGDPYVDMASDIYGVPLDDVTPDQRLIGKMAILGLGYAMSAPTFVAQCKSMANITITRDFAQDVVTTYRRKYSKIPELWRKLEYTQLASIRSGSATTSGLKFIQDKGYNIVFLPSGRAIYYPGATEIKGKFGNQQPAYLKAYGNNMVQVGIYGGKITENVVQAIARDILAQAMVRLGMAGYTPCLHVHDEAVLQVRDSEALVVEAQFRKAFLQRENWNREIPLDVETWIGKRYHK